jgi:TRAP-type C4-dicarboxylate transport system permease large subunit
MSKVTLGGMQLVGAITVILAVVLGFNNFLIDQEIPQSILGWIQQYISNPMLFLLGLNVFLLIVGCLMDIFSAMVAVLPLIIPLAQGYGVAPEHLAIIFLANLEIGYLTPPVGMNLFISSLHFEKSLVKVSRSVLPFIGLLAIALGLITYVPALSTWLPKAVEGELPTAALPSQPQGGSGSIMDTFGGFDDIEALLNEIEDADLAEQKAANGEPGPD